MWDERNIVIPALYTGTRIGAQVPVLEWRARLLLYGLLSPPSLVFSHFLTLWPFYTVPHVVVTPNHKTILLLPHNCYFATVNHNVKI